MKTCKDCVHFIGGGIWNLCCAIFPWYRYENTPICQSFEERENTQNEIINAPREEHHV